MVTNTLFAVVGRFAARRRARLARSGIVALLAIGAVAMTPALAQAGTPGLSNAGTEFWLGFTTNYVRGSALTLYIAGETATTGTVSIPGESFSESFSVTPGEVTAVKIPSNNQMNTSDGIEEKAVHVTAGAPVVVYGLNDEPFTPEFRVLTTGMASGEVEYGLIDESEWSTPSWIDTPKAQRAMEDMVTADVIYGGSVSYRYASPCPLTHVSPSVSSKLGG